MEIYQSKQAMATERRLAFKKSINAASPSTTSIAAAELFPAMSQQQQPVTQCDCRPASLKTTVTSTVQLPTASQVVEAPPSTSGPSLDDIAYQTFGKAWKEILLAVWRFENEFYDTPPEDRRELLTNFIVSGLKVPL